MTIAPLPTPVAATPGTGRSGGPGTGSSETSADVFATLVEAVLGSTKGSPTGSPIGEADGTRTGAATGTGVTGEAGGPVSPESAEATTTAGPADLEDPGSEPTDALAGTAVPPMFATPFVAPALAAALGLDSAGVPAGDPADSTCGASATPATSAAGADGAALLASMTVGSSMPEGAGTASEPATDSLAGTGTGTGDPAPGAAATGTPNDGPEPAPAVVPTATDAGRHADGMSTDAGRMTSPSDASQDRPTATPTDAGRHADGTSTDAGRMTSPSDATETRTADAPGPTLVQTTQSTQATQGTQTTQAVDAAQATTRTADAPPTTQVTRSAAAQVVPELTRLVQAGPGTHRMVLRLDPEHLGEVRITLTVHPGGVRVRMAAGSEDARVALSDGLPELQRALGAAAGRPAGETQVAVLHQPAGQQPRPEQGTAYDGGTPSAQTDAGQASDHQTPGDRPQAGDRDAGRPARTQVDTTARDGSQGAGTPRPADPPTSYRGTIARLDVSM
jgi:flagellar hook-length control protein FliK